MKRLDGKLESGKVKLMEKLFVERAKQCSGFVVHRVGETAHNGAGSRGTCALCNGLTHDYCLGCHLWLCASLSKHAVDSKAVKPHVIIENPLLSNGTPIHCTNSCFSVMHRDNQQAALNLIEQEHIVTPLATPKSFFPK